MMRALMCLLSIFYSLSVWAQAAALAPIRLATTTSTEQSGLLAWLLPHFTAEHGYPVQVIAAGSGQSLRLGEQGDVDILLTHSPAAEAAFIARGFGVQAAQLMANDFVFLGPETDTAHVRRATSAAEALQRIAHANAPFISRGDDSGTHKKELTLWQAAARTPTFSQYRVIGQGMGPTLLMAGELGAYTLSDRATWLAYQQQLPLRLLLAGDPALYNPYQVILVNPARYPDLNVAGAQALRDWLLSPSGQARIGAFAVDGTRLFVPLAERGHER
ncbi:MAG: substrate-binding domain-containing protein [Aeromonas sp.]